MARTTFSALRVRGCVRAAVVGAAVLLLGASAALACTPTVKNPLTVSRTIVLDAEKGPHFGTINYGAHRLLRKNEVVLTYDDGPFPGRTEAILRALKAHCAKATFFAVGRMAMAYPTVLAKVHKAGHTIGTHTWAHANLRALDEATARERIEMGMAAVSAAIGAPISPLFRFPFLSENKSLLNYVRSQDISSISVDVVPGDTQGYGPKALVQRTINGARRFGGGILLYHDIKPATAAATAEILAQLSKNGFKLVHLTTKQPHIPKPRLYARFEARRTRQKTNALALRSGDRGKSGAVTKARIAPPQRRPAPGAARRIAAPGSGGASSVFGFAGLRPSQTAFDDDGRLRTDVPLRQPGSNAAVVSQIRTTSTSASRLADPVAARNAAWRARFKPVLVGEISQASIADMIKPAAKPVAVAALTKATTPRAKPRGERQRLRRIQTRAPATRTKNRRKPAQRARVASTRRQRAVRRSQAAQRRQRQPRRQPQRRRKQWFFNFGSNAR
ncbi:MAG: polysaccharide deacetylase family protein [Pseudomonadota bacterium]